MYFYIMDIPITLAVISFQADQSSHYAKGIPLELVVSHAETKQAKSFAPLPFSNFITTTT